MASTKRSNGNKLINNLVDNIADNHPERTYLNHIVENFDQLEDMKYQLKNRLSERNKNIKDIKEFVEQLKKI